MSIVDLLDRAIDLYRENTGREPYNLKLTRRAYDELRREHQSKNLLVTSPGRKNPKYRDITITIVDTGGVA